MSLTIGHPNQSGRDISPQKSPIQQMSKSYALSSEMSRRVTQKEECIQIDRRY